MKKERQSIVSTVTLTAASTEILPASANRVAIVFSPPTTSPNAYTLANESVTAAGAGIYITTATDPVTFTIEKHGSAVRRAWFAIANTGFTIGIMEVLE